jgi:signal transduction histidine kinase/ActR/RegA family two-component response regulator
MDPMRPEWSDEPTGPVRQLGRSSATHPALGRQTWLTVLGGVDAGRRYPVTTEVKLGRDQAATIQVAANDVSRRHAHIVKKADGSVVVEDLGSRNGTFVNGERIERQILRHGDQLQLGAETVYLYTDVSLIEEQLQNEQRMASIARMAGGLAQDYNNLMAVVVAEADYLRRGLQQEGSVAREELLECVHNIEAAAQRAAAITRQVISFAQRGRSENRPVDLHALIEELTALLRPSYEPTVTIRVDVERALSVLGDATALHQMLRQLCDQARQAMPDGGALSIKAAAVVLSDDRTTAVSLASGRYALLTVQDTGVGMAPDECARLFEPFHDTPARGRGPRRRRPASVYGIVKSHHGHIEVESEPGWGSLFRIYLPLAASVAPEISSTPTGPAAQAVAAAGTVLVVEDVEAERMLARRMLEQLGCRVLEARDGREAIRQFMTHRKGIDLVLLDMILPNVGGKEAFRWMMKIDPTVSVVLTSAYLAEDRASELLAEGARAFVPKPLGLDALRKIVQSVIGARRALAQPL